MKKEIKQIIRKAEMESRRKGTYPYLTDIIAILRQMLDSFCSGEIEDHKFRKKIVGGLGRIVTEDYSFSESSLGSQLLEIGEQYLNFKSKKG